MAKKVESHNLVGTSDRFWNILNGYNTGKIPDDDTDFLLDSTGITLGNNERSGHPKNANGQYASIPGTTPKYLRHLPGSNRENYSTIARMLVRVKDVNVARRITNNLRDAVSKDVASTLLGNGKTGALGYIDFFLENVQASHVEKVQVTEVLEDNFVAFFFGSQPPTYTFSGNLMNTIQDDWAVQMLSAYQYILRGTQLARRGVLLYIRYDSYMIAGVMLNLSMQRMASNETVVPFSFQMLVHKIHRMYDTAYGATQIPAYGYENFDPEDANPFVEVRPAALKPYLSRPGKDAVNSNNPKEPADVMTGANDAARDAAVEDAKQREEIETANVNDAGSTRFDEASATGIQAQTVKELGDQRRAEEAAALPPLPPENMKNMFQ